MSQVVLGSHEAEVCFTCDTEQMYVAQKSEEAAQPPRHSSPSLRILTENQAYGGPSFRRALHRQGWCPRMKQVGDARCP